MEARTRPYTFIESVLARPKMYTPTGTLGEVGGFLEGYYSGVAKSFYLGYAKDKVNSWIEEHNNFEEWLEEKMGREKRNRRVFTRIIEQYGDGAEGLAQTLAWYREFRDARKEPKEEPR